jgi:glycerophosphoryl diester phosphodiesterase
MKQFLLFILLLISVQCKNTVNTVERIAQIREKLESRNIETVLVTAHRGDWRYAPENSIASIEHSIKMGVDVVEIDLQLTKDSVLILMHDNTIDRTTPGKGNVSDWTMDSLRTLQLKNGCGIKTKYKVPTLEEVLLSAKGKVFINLDKGDRFFDQVFPLLEATGTTRQIIMKGSKSPEEVKQLYGKYLHEVIYMPIVDLDKKNAAEQVNLFLKELKSVAFELLFVNDNHPLPKQMREQLAGKSLIWYNTLWDTMAGGHDDDMSLENPDAGYGYLIDTLGAKMIQTDRPAYLLEYLRRRGLHD